MPKLTRDEDKVKARYLAGRTKKARRMLAMFYDKNDIETSIADCIADLMHLATAQAFNYWEAHDRGLSHHNAEQAGGEHG